MAYRWLLGLLIVVLQLGSVAGSSTGAEPDGMAFFEQKIRPVLVQHCYQCHSAQSKSLKGGLLLDTKQGLLAGGDSGPSLVPGKAKESLLIEALKYETLEMPPAGKLPPQVIADFERWVNLGAPDPRTGKLAAKAKIDVEAGRQFWAYQLPRPQQPPRVKGTAWPATDIDRFILARLEANQLRPAAEADPRTLIQRLYYDLIGLPPTEEDVEKFVAACESIKPRPLVAEPADRDQRSRLYEDAYAALVDKLLASPHFGERWGRHWLDVVRYAESLTLRGFVLKDAWRYRDYVIDSFNDDVPFDQFVREQIAGDLLPHGSVDEHRRHVIATAFLAIGNTNLEEQDKKQLVMDIVDEQLDVIGKGLLAQTITCARCHDHKFDPITARDYYAMAGILKNTKTVEHSNVSKWLEMPLPEGPAKEKEYQAAATEVASLQAQIKLMKASLANQAAASETADEPAKIVAVADLKGIVVDDAKANKVGNWKPSQIVKRFVGEGYVHDDGKEKGEKTITFIPVLPSDGQYEVRLAYIPGSGRSAKVPLTVMSAEGELEVFVDQTEDPPIDGRWVSLGAYRFERVGQSYVIVSNEGTKGIVTADAVQFLPVKATDDQDKAKQDDKQADDPRKAELKRLEDRMKQMTAEMAKRPTWIGVTEAKEIGDTAIHIRGNVHNLGETIPRGFIQVAHYGPTPTFTPQQSGRRELADWLTSRDNPLTARVMTNRVWLWLFGEGLVRTPDNFGATGEPPTHPELLDHLAIEFVKNDWSIKQLVRTIVMSRTYRQSSISDFGFRTSDSKKVAASVNSRTSNPQSAIANPQSKDPENRLWSHANRRRMDAESLRDKLLWISGTLSLERGGVTFASTGRADRMTGLASDYNYVHNDTRRSVYSPGFRNSPVELYEVFDLADSSTVTGKRNVSTVAPQALYLMNHPFVIEQSRLTARRLIDQKLDNDRARIDRAYRLVLGRQPTSHELALAERFVKLPGDAKGPQRERAWSQFVQMLICSLDFRYIN